jgi:hypothetical protein
MAITPIEARCGRGRRAHCDGAVSAHVPVGVIDGVTDGGREGCFQEGLLDPPDVVGHVGGLHPNGKTRQEVAQPGNLDVGAVCGDDQGRRGRNVDIGGNEAVEGGRFGAHVGRFSSSAVQRLPHRAFTPRSNGRQASDETQVTSLRRRSGRHHHARDRRRRHEDRSALAFFSAHLRLREGDEPAHPASSSCPPSICLPSRRSLRRARR